MDSLGELIKAVFVLCKSIAQPLLSLSSSSLLISCSNLLFTSIAARATLHPSALIAPFSQHKQEHQFTIMSKGSPFASFLIIGSTSSLYFRPAVQVSNIYCLQQHASSSASSSLPSPTITTSYGPLQKLAPHLASATALRSLLLANPTWLVSKLIAALCTNLHL